MMYTKARIRAIRRTMEPGTDMTEDQTRLMIYLNIDYFRKEIRGRTETPEERLRRVNIALDTALKTKSYRQVRSAA